MGNNTRLDFLDEALGEIKRGELFLVCGRPCVGKTRFITTIASKALQKGIACQIFTQEEYAKNIKARMGIDWQSEPPNLSICEEGNLNKESLNGKIVNSTQFVFIDYLQLYGSESATLEQKLTELKEISQRKNVAVIVVGQVSRGLQHIFPRTRLQVQWLKDKENVWKYPLISCIDTLLFIDAYGARIDNREKDCNHSFTDFIVVKGKMIGSYAYDFNR